MLVLFSSPLAMFPLFSGPLQKVTPTFRSTPTPPKYYVSVNILCFVYGFAKFLLIIKNNVLKMIMVKFLLMYFNIPLRGVGVDRKVGVTFWRGPENRGNIASGLEKRTSMRKGRVNGGQVKTWSC
jgi:hypothetical protein